MQKTNTEKSRIRIKESRKDEIYNRGIILFEIQDLKLDLSKNSANIPTNQEVSIGHWEADGGVIVIFHQITSQTRALPVSMGRGWIKTSHKNICYKHSGQMFSKPQVWYDKYLLYNTF